MSAPPDKVIEWACAAARQSPCAKSKRGVILYWKHDPTLHAQGYNAPPPPFTCSGSADCKSHCAKICTHAEMGALMYLNALERGCALLKGPSLVSFELVHVKVMDGVLVPGGPPSCWQCSREICDNKRLIAGVWLYEEVGELFARRDERGAVDGTYRKGEWRFYDAVTFHRETLRYCGLPATEDK